MYRVVNSIHLLPFSNVHGISNFSNLCPARGLSTSLAAQTVKRLSAMQETWVQSLGWEDLLEKEMAPLSSTLAWKILWMEEPGRLQSKGSQRVGHDWATSLHFRGLSVWLISFKESALIFSLLICYFQFYWFVLNFLNISFLLLTLDLICPSLSGFLMQRLKLLIKIFFFSNIYFNAVNFPLSIAFTASYILHVEF